LQSVVERGFDIVGVAFKIGGLDLGFSHEAVRLRVRSQFRTGPLTKRDGLQRNCALTPTG
jgi:hypothetical protein